MNLSSEVLLKISALVDKLDIDIESLDIDTSGKTNDEALREAGLRLVYLAFRKLHKAETELYALIAAYRGVTTAEAKKLDAIEIVKEIFQQEGIADFFK